ncbi:unnamed protein product [Protopolystoma xenopodis]|uniref:Uncharacterized protein n=1 Tax=Protopolystoma xenopodis TaxID=117903 RepID=A0A3S5AYB5_9PLAT|nr:unnamed protein product [Protopolystoma xenopodis]
MYITLPPPHKDKKPINITRRTNGLQFRPRIGLINTLSESRAAPILQCRGSTPAKGVDDTDASSKLQST